MPPSTIAGSKVDGRVQNCAPASSVPVYLALAGCSAVLLIFCLVSDPPGSAPSALPLLETFLLLTPPLLVPAAFFHERKAWRRRDAFLMIPWTLLIALLITQAAPTSATYAFPLRDSLWRSTDEHLGISIPAMMTFAARHPLLQSVLTDCYGWALHPLVLLAIFLPALVGMRETAQRFVLANAFSFVLALPFMLLLPAVGPWVGWHFHPTHLQQACEASIYSLRRGSLSITDAFGGIVCLPSFHVFWAVVSAQALQPFRLLRYPAILVAALITVSTMTTGWHYGVDVIAGLLMFAICGFLANWVVSGRPNLSFASKHRQVSMGKGSA